MCIRDSTDRVVRESYERLSDDEYSMLIDDRDVEVLEHTEYEDESTTALGVMSENITSIDSGMGDDTTISIDNTPMLHDVVIHRTSKKGKTCIEGIPPEEMLVESNAKGIEDANFIAQRKMMTRGELIELGFDRGIVETLPNDRVEDMNQEYQTRHQDIHNTIQRENTDEATQEVEVFECYVKCDYSGTGKAELRKFVVAGNNGSTLLSDEPYDSFPYVTATPIIMPHRLYGRSIAELVEDVQSVKTYVMRALNDNIYGIQNNRLAIDDLSLIHISEPTRPY